MKEIVKYIPMCASTGFSMAEAFLQTQDRSYFYRPYKDAIYTVVVKDMFDKGKRMADQAYELNKIAEHVIEKGSWKHPKFLIDKDKYATQLVFMEDNLTDVQVNLVCKSIIKTFKKNSHIPPMTGFIFIWSREFDQVHTFTSVIYKRNASESELITYKGQECGVMDANVIAAMALRHPDIEYKSIVKEGHYWMVACPKTSQRVEQTMLNVEALEHIFNQSNILDSFGGQKNRFYS